MKILRPLAFGVLLFLATTPAAFAQGYLRAGPYGYVVRHGYFLPYSYEYYLPSDQHRFYDRSSTDFNS
jgi:hypothetical protein